MRIKAVLAVLLTGGSFLPQETAAPSHKLVSVESKGEQFVATFATPYPKGLTVRADVTRSYFTLDWTPWLETLPGGSVIEQVNLYIHQDSAEVTGELPPIAIDKDGKFDLTFKPPHPGLYLGRVAFDPRRQRVKFEGKLEAARSSHLLITVDETKIREIIVDEAQTALEYVSDFFASLRTAIGNARSDLEIQDAMRAKTDEAAKRVLNTLHPGTYALLTHLNAYVGTIPDDPKEPTGSRSHTPNKIAIKTRNLPYSVIRESIMLCYLFAQNCLEEANRIAGDPGAKGRDEVEKTLLAVAKELAPSAKALVTLDRDGRVGALISKTGTMALLTEAAALIERLGDRGEPLDKEVAAWIERANKATLTICDAKVSLSVAATAPPK